MREIIRERKKQQHWIWKLTLAVVFLAFGMLIMAQYQTHLLERGSLVNESEEDLALIMKTVTDNKLTLEEELTNVKAELAEVQAALSSGDDLSNTAENRIQHLRTAIGSSAVAGKGISITFASSNTLIYLDLIDMVNELMNSGAEAVAINDIRFTTRTQISEKGRTTEYTDQTTGEIQRNTSYSIYIDGNELRTPIVIRAIGDPDVLETALTYPGGFISNLNTLYDIHPTIRHAANLIIPAVTFYAYEYAQPLTLQ